MVILVCGFGRCGSSLTMQLLEAGGVPCFGRAPFFEPDELGIERDLQKLVPQLNGKAAKVLGPQRCEWPQRDDYKVIWLDRDPHEQAKSQIKWLKHWAYSMTRRREVLLPATKERIEERAASIAQDREACMDLFPKIGAAVCMLRFEQLLSEPATQSERIAGFLGLPLDVDAMAKVVQRRPSECAPSLNMEISLIVERDYEKTQLCLSV